MTTIQFKQWLETTLKEDDDNDGDQDNPLTQGEVDFDDTGKAGEGDKTDATDQVHNQGGFKAQTWDGKTFRNLHKIVKQMKSKPTEDDAVFRATNIKGPDTVVSNKANKQTDYGHEGGIAAEELDHLDEISKKTLGSYIGNATSDLAGASHDAVKLTALGYPKSAERARKLANKRYKGIQLAAKKVASEELVNELSKQTLASYSQKAGNEIIKKRDKKTIIKRSAGIHQAAKKFAKEEFELNELSANLVKHYLNKARDSGARSIRQALISPTEYGADKNARRAARRVKGIALAKKKLTREEKQELKNYILNEISKKTLASYSQKAGQSVQKDRSKKNLIKRFKGIHQAAKKMG